MKKELKIEDIKVNNLYNISDIVALEQKTGVDIIWHQVGSSKCRITKINLN